MSLKKLWEMQQMRQRYLQLKQQIKTSPLGLKLEKEKHVMEKIRADLTERREALRRLSRELRQRELDAKEVGEKIKRLEQKLYEGNITNSRELKSLEENLRWVKQEQEEIEEEIINMALQEEQLEEELRKAEQEFQQLEQTYSAALEEYHRWKQELEEEMRRIEVSHHQIIFQIDKDLLKLYKKMRPKYGERVVARVENQTCTGCRVQIPTSLLQALRRQTDLIRCENCGRLLLYE
ncbi:zinc ribbon domain-containing protein [Calderihabitans maritimus]|uniref:Uncharacterized protein n=1 Tax=Calderihabitans maritimus TaxID=1246530 RepID=A0A1Z5HN44_9FIRM|nr:C4-type zinc ribbon domain-containing protein [Calderihabitans maritimus]GAW90934.1 hypothetical protein PTH_0915 [Calderihabitans maritimus]